MSMYRLQRLHIVDSALIGTSSSAPHSKQVIRLRSGPCSVAFGAGRRISGIRRCSPHFLQLLEMAVRGSSCWWPQRGQATRTLSCFFGGIYFLVGDEITNLKFPVLWKQIRDSSRRLLQLTG